MTEPIAVVGVSALFAGSPDVAALWQNIVAGTDLIGDVPSTHWLARDYYDADPYAPDKTYCKRGSFLSPVAFDALKYGIPPSIVPATDTSQLLALMLTDRLLEDINQDALKKVDREKISIILGVTGTTEMTAHMSGRMSRPMWEQGLRDAGFADDEVTRIADRIAANFVPWQESTFPGLLGNVVAGRIANRFDLGGTNCVVDAACASSLAALSMAMNELHQGQSDLAIVGGIDTLNDPLMYLCFSKTPALSMTGDCRPFSDTADGTILGEGLSLLALRRLSDAERDGDHIYALIRGVGTSSDGRSKSVYAPRSEGQAKALRRAYAAAGYSPRTVEMVEAHGTATKAGDVAEIGGLATVFGECAEGATGWCAVGSIKSQIGHTKAAAGMAGMAKAVLSLHHKVLPPTIKVEKPNGKLALADSPFFVNVAPRPWVRGADHPRRAAVSSFGFGGSNFHVTLEEYTGAAAVQERVSYSPTELFLFSGSDATAVAQQGLQLVGTARQGVASELRRLAHQSQRTFDASHPAKLAIVVASLDYLQTRLNDFLKTGPAKSGIRTADGVYFGNSKQPGKVGWLFPGQGSQYVGMGQDLATAFETARSVWDVAADVPDLADAPLHRIVFPVPAFSTEERDAQETLLRQTDNAQPALGAAGLAAAKILKSLHIPMDAAAGHSFGELTALCVTGALTERSLLTLAKLRGVLMESSNETPGAMTAVRESAANIAALVRGHFPRVFIANDNSPKQVVVGGDVADVAAFEEELARQRVSFKRLNVSAAFHSPALQSCSDRFASAMPRHMLGTPETPVFANTTAEPYPTKLSEARTLLANHLARPVRFRESLLAMYAAGVRTFIEVGPGAVLTGLVGDCLDNKGDVTAVALDRKGTHGVTTFWHALAQLAVVGVPIDWSALTSDFATPPEPLVIDPKRTLQICGANYGKPYPRKEGAAAPVVPTAVTAKTNVAGTNGRKDASSAASKSLPATAPAVAGVVRRIPDSVVVSASPAANRVSSSVSVGVPAVGVSVPPAVRSTAASSSVSPLPTHGSQSRREEVVLEAQTMNSSQLPSGQSSDNGDACVSGTASAYVLELQRQTADVHRVYLQTMAQSHMAFLQAMNPSSLNACVEAQLAEVPVAAAASVVPVAVTPTAVVERPAAPKVVAAPVVVALPKVVAAPVVVPAAKPVVIEERAVEPVAPAVVVAKKVSGSVAALQKTLLEVVAEKTGYPVEVLEMDLDIEAGLGIDSIKRVEILSALMERHPELPEMQLSELGSLRTLGDLLGAVAGAGGGTAETAAPAVVAPSTTATQRPAPEPVAPVQVAAVSQPVAVGTSAAALQHTLLEVVAEKTGYPVEVLDLSLDIEAGLGIDSIKRVEILSALMERHPELPEMQLSELGGLRTLGDLLGAVAANCPSDECCGASCEIDLDDDLDEPPTTNSGPGSAELKRILLEVVSEKTGYPTDVLDLDMEIEASLGIDSIKRVEILSAVMERVPGLPEVQMSELGGLVTLRDVMSRFEATGEPTRSSVVVEQRTPNFSQEPQSSEPLTSGDCGSKIVSEDLESNHYVADNGRIRRLVVRLEQAPATGFALPVLTEGAPVVVMVGCQATDFALATAKELVAQLAEHGVLSAVVDEVPIEARSVIHLGGLCEPRAWQTGSVLLHDVLSAAKTLAKHADREAVALVTVQDTGGAFGLDGLEVERAWLAGLPGIAKTAATEWPTSAVKAIDIQCEKRSPAQVAAQISRELFVGGPELEVALRADGSRWTLRAVDMPVTGQLRNTLTSDDVVMVSGGARGVTAATIIELAKVTQAKFVLLGRTDFRDEPDRFPAALDDRALKQAVIAVMVAQGQKPLPVQIEREVSEIVGQREIRDTLQQLADAGSQACYVAVDIRDESALQQLVQSIRDQWGPVRGIIHGAGVLADKKILDKTAEQFDKVLQTKIAGLSALLAATRDEPLSLIALFSSVAARYGNAGQCDYAAGNEILNKVAQAERARRGETCQVKSINWGPWDGGMVTPALKALFQKRGIEPIPLDVGARMFVDEMLRSDGAHVEVVIGGDSELRATAPLRATDTEMHVCVSPERHGFLEDHRVKDVPVLPMVLALEWFVRTARSRHPDMHLVRCRDLQVLKGVPLNDFETGRRFRMQCLETHTNGTIELQMELTGLDRTKHYRCKADLAPSKLGHLPQIAGALPSGGPWPWSIDEAYELLFHGPDFQVLRSLDGLSEQGARANLTGIRSKLWLDGPWQTDAPAIDGAMQLALLWSLRRTGRSSLPTSVKSVRLLSTSGHHSMMKCEVLAKRIGPHTHHFDVRITSESGEIILEMEDLEMALMAATQA